MSRGGLGRGLRMRLCRADVARPGPPLVKYFTISLDYCPFRALNRSPFSFQPYSAPACSLKLTFRTPTSHGEYLPTMEQLAPL